MNQEYIDRINELTEKMYTITGIPKDATEEEKALIMRAQGHGVSSLSCFILGMMKYHSRKEAERVNKRKRRKEHRQSPVLTGRAYYENIARRNSRPGRS